jgi:hypothetical protein
MKGFIPVYNHCRNTVARIAQSGWRPVFCWLGVAVGYFSFIYAPAHGIHVDSGAVNIFLSMITGTFVVRAAEKAHERVLNPSPNGGLVNTHAIS